MDGPPDHLDQVMDARRLDLDLEWQDVAEAAKISVANLRSIRRGKTKPSSLTARRIENVLQWEHGGFEVAWAGGIPKVKQVPESEHQDPVVAGLAERLARLEQAAAQHREENNELRKMLKEITGKDPGISGGEEPENDSPRQAM